MTAVANWTPCLAYRDYSDLDRARPAGRMSGHVSLVDSRIEDDVISLLQRP
jgi:hypothetical protein